MKTIRIPRLAIILIAIAAVAAGCAPPAGPTSSAGGPAEKPVAKKIVTLAVPYEPAAITETFVPKAPSGNNLPPIAHDGLIRSPSFDLYEPQLAVRIPTIEEGTWKINPNGSMETVWRLRPNVKWHDGRSFTSADLLFSYRANRDPDLVGTLLQSAAARVLESASAPDDLTFVMHWNAPYVEAYRTGIGDIMPKHLIEDLYLKDKESLLTTPLFSTEFIGLGPYRLVGWERGSHVELVRFDDYYTGRPPLDTVYVRFFTDTNAMVAAALSGSVDAVANGAAGGGVSLDQAMEVKLRWEGTGHRVVTSQTGSPLWADSQYRKEYARPLVASGNLLVRKALLHAIDRDALVGVMTHGLSPVADSYYMPDEARRPDMESYIVKYAHDPTRAAQLLTEAGWTRGQDGILTHSTGQRFEIEFWARSGSDDKVANIVTDDWKRIGVAGQPYVIPAALRSDREYEAKRPGYVCCLRSGLSSHLGGKLHQRSISSEQTRWNGSNYSQYVNPRADALLDQLERTLDPRARVPLEQQLVREYTSDVSMLPMWWEIFPALIRAGIKGPRAAFATATANFFEWDKE